MSDNIDSEKLLNRIRDGLGMDYDEKLVVQTPKFERTDGVEPAEPPLTESAMDQIKSAEKETLTQFGLQKWSDDTGLWLLPHEWHPHIPEDYELLSIMNERKTRRDMPANPDKRFGMLSVGIVPEFEKGESDD